MPGLTAAAKWMMTASVMEDVIQMRSAKVSTAHAITSRAGASARSFAACAACAASACRRAASSASPAVTCSGYVGLVALNLTGRLPSVKRSRSRPYSPCNHMPRRKCSHEPTLVRAACGSSEVSRKSPDHTHSAYRSRHSRPTRHRRFRGLLLPLPDPGHWRLGPLVLAVAPVTAPALFVVRGPAGRADHAAIIKVSDSILGTVSRRSPTAHGAADTKQR